MLQKNASKFAVFSSNAPVPLPSKRPGTQSGSGNRPLANVKIKEVLPHPDEPATVKKAQSEFLWLNKEWESKIDALWIIDWLIRLLIYN